MGSLKLNHSRCYSDEELEQMKKHVLEGSISAQIELAALMLEDAVDVEKNHAFLKEQAEKGNTLALIDLGFIYLGDVTRKEADGREVVLIPENEELSDACFLKAAELGSAHGMCITGVHKYLKTWIEDGKNITDKDFIEAEKWMTLAIETFEKTESDLAPSLALLATDCLAKLYTNLNPKNPIYSEEKANTWRNKNGQFNQH